MALKPPAVRIEARRASAQTCIIDIQGELTAFAEEQLMAAYTEACSNGAGNIILNFDRLAYMSSSGIGLLVTLLIRAQRQQQRLLACGLSEHYRHIFELTRLNEAITVHEGEATAMASLERRHA
ncbi:MAG: STAS domain-containing protein [Anaerolineae bacterium]|nr:STAS domain-containing protein [Anaerolineae bacterium]